jgi:hypothetical protein
MALRKQWRELSRSTTGSAPERYGYYELGDADGTVVRRDWRVLRYAPQELLAYGDAELAPSQVAEHREPADELFEDHADNCP